MKSKLKLFKDRWGNSMTLMQWLNYKYAQRQWAIIARGVREAQRIIPDEETPGEIIRAWKEEMVRRTGSLRTANAEFLAIFRGSSRIRTLTFDLKFRRFVQKFRRMWAILCE